MNTVFITGADRGIGYALCEQFAAGGYQIFAGQFMPDWKELTALSQKYPRQVTCIPLDIGNTDSVIQAAAKTAACLAGKSLDILINCAGIAQEDDYTGLYQAINVNAVGALRMTELFMPMMERGQKRIGIVSSEAGCLSLLHRDGGFSYCTSKTVLNMTARLMFNEMKTLGYSFRMYHPGWIKSYMSGEKTMVGNFEPEETAAAAYRQFTSDRDFEQVLVMTDIMGEMWPV